MTGSDQGTTKDNFKDEAECMAYYSHKMASKFSLRLDTENLGRKRIMEPRSHMPFGTCKRKEHMGTCFQDTVLGSC